MLGLLQHPRSDPIDLLITLGIYRDIHREDIGHRRTFVPIRITLRRTPEYSSNYGASQPTLRYGATRLRHYSTQAILRNLVTSPRVPLKVPIKQHAATPQLPTPVGRPTWRRAAAFHSFARASHAYRVGGVLAVSDVIP